MFDRHLHCFASFDLVGFCLDLFGFCFDLFGFCFDLFGFCFDLGYASPGSAVLFNVIIIIR